MVLIGTFLCALFLAGAASAELPFTAFDPGWKAAVGEEFRKPYFARLQNFLTAEREAKEIFPSERETFTAFELVPFDRVRVVIIGQDPYPGVEIDQYGAERPLGHGLAFSVRPEIRKIPGSLMNIFKKLNRDTGTPIPTQGSLVPWARQGVLLLNATLTLERGKANSHFNKPARDANWGLFTDAVIETVAAGRKGVVFVLWGEFAQQKEKIISKYAYNGHLVLKGAHPSPQSVNAFLNGPRFFNEINNKLQAGGGRPIDWSLP